MRDLRLAFTFVVMVVAAGWAQISVQHVVANALQARGGAAAFAAVRSIHLRGHLELPQSGATVEVWCTSQPARIRIEVSLAGGLLTQGYDGKTAWQISPGSKQSETLSGSPANQVVDQALNFVDLLADAEARKVLVGQGTLDGHDYYKVRSTLPTGDSFTQYIDAHSWLTFHEEYPGGVEDISDYREVTGLRLPFRYASGPVGQRPVVMIWDAIKLNAPAAASRFRRPGN